MPTFLDLLKSANSSKDKQRHRLTPDSKAGRRFLSNDKDNKLNKDKLQAVNLGGNLPNEPRELRTAGLNGKTDI